MAMLIDVQATMERNSRGLHQVFLLLQQAFESADAENKDIIIHEEIQIFQPLFIMFLLKFLREHQAFTLELDPCVQNYLLERQKCLLQKIVHGENIFICADENINELEKKTIQWERFLERQNRNSFQIIIGVSNYLKSFNEIPSKMTIEEVINQFKTPKEANDHSIKNFQAKTIKYIKDMRGGKNDGNNQFLIEVYDDIMKKKQSIRLPVYRL